MLQSKLEKAADLAIGVLDTESNKSVCLFAFAVVVNLRHLLLNCTLSENTKDKMSNVPAARYTNLCRARNLLKLILKKAKIC